MNQFFFDVLGIIGTLLLALFGVSFAIERLHKFSWHFFWIAFICFAGVGSISYFKNSESPTKETPTSIDLIAIKNDSIKRLQSNDIPKKKKSQTNTKLDSILQLSTYLQLRANVEVLNIGFDKLGIEKPPHVNFDVYNSGQTPADSVCDIYCIKIGTGIYESDFVEGENFEKYNFFSLGSHVRMAKGDDFNRKLSSDELELILKGQKNLYFLGVITYRDEFNKPRYTKFGAQYDPITGNIFPKYSDTK
jgi:hypothetical protein